MMKKVRDLLFPQKGKDKLVVRLYFVVMYTFIILGILFSFYSSITNTFKQAYLLTVNDVDREFSWALLDSSITSDTVSVFVNARLSGSNRITKFDEYNTGYEYQLELINNIIPELALKNPELSNNIYKVGDITKQNIEKYKIAREKNFTISDAIIEAFLYILFLIIPLFIFLRSIVYFIVLYIIYGNNKKS